MPEPNLVMTIGDDDDVPVIESDSDEEQQPKASDKKSKSSSVAKKGKAKTKDKFSKDFVFRFDEDGLGGGGWDLEGATRLLDEKQSHFLTSIDEKIERRRALKDEESDVSGEEEGAENKDTLVDSSEDDGSDDEDDSAEQLTSLAQQKHGAYADTESEEEDDSDEDGDGVQERLDGGLSDEEVEEEKAKEKERKKQAFFGKIETVDALSFQDMNLSRPLLRAVTAMGYNNPTTVQARTIPVALLAKDICACANTGSGKTASFMLPVLERLLYRPRTNPTTRVLVLSPTRELAAQCHAVATKLAQFTDITFSLVVGGLSDKKQAVELRHNPDVIIATPGRLIDHIHNTASFDLQGIEILIMDEADRLLEMGFQEEVQEIVRNCPRGRQTMLFSATMTDEVDDLVNLSLHEPIRLFVHKNTETAANLVQEFVRIRQTREGDRDAFLLALCKRTYKTKCIIFFRSKAAAHRMKIIFGLMGLNSSELHGNLTQGQRLESLEKFRHGEVDFLLATDLAGRGLDIQGVEVVINFTMPHNLTQYIHRVGRTARAGKHGTAITLVGESERKLLKEIVKSAKDLPKSRVIPPAVVERYRLKIENMANDVKAIMIQEKEERWLEVAERDAMKAQNLVDHEKEIFSRPAKQWFQSEKDKQQLKELGKRAYEGEDVSTEMQQLNSKKPKIEDTDDAPLPLEGVRATAQEKRARSRKQKRALAAKLEDDETSIGAIKKAARDAKRAKRTPRIHVHTPDRDDAKPKKSKTTKKGGFEKDLTDTSKKALKGTTKPVLDKASKRDLKIKEAKASMEKKNRVKELRKTKSVNSFKSKKRYKRH